MTVLRKELDTPEVISPHRAALRAGGSQLLVSQTWSRISPLLTTRPDDDALSFTRLHDMLGLTPGNLIIQLRKLEEAGYLSSQKTRNGSGTKTTVALTSHGRKALNTYTQALRDLLDGL